MSRLRSLLALIATGLTLSACSNPSADPRAVEDFAAVEPAQLSRTLSDRAAHHGVDGGSVTIRMGDAVRTVHHGAAGDDTLMQAASLSKAVAAAGILTLMEREGIDMDADIRDRVTSVDLRLLNGGDRPLTMRELLSHTGGATQSGYPGYRRGQALPSPTEVVTDPPNRFVSRVDLSLPKGAFSYAGGGYQIAQVFAEDVSGQPFADLMDELVLAPLGMTRSTFAQPIDPKDIAPLSVLPASSGPRPMEGLLRPLKESWMIYPEQAAAGLWTTTSDYARFVGALLDAAAGRDSTLSSEVAAAMLTPVARTPFGDDAHYGLGVSLIVDAADGRIVNVSHSGLNAGYRALFAADPASGRIVVSFGNTPGAVALNNEAVDGLMRNPALP
ncbi:MAG: serine hydrolase domain-containing protein [Litorimonas sp.]